jgi:ornithine cyclodeaminase
MAMTSSTRFGPSLRVISGPEARALLPMADAIGLMADVLAALSAHRAHVPLRSAMPVGPGGNRLGLMPGVLEHPAVFGIKLLSLFPQNAAAGLSSHLGLVALFEAHHGQPVALLEASALTAIRTAAVSAVATRLLAREDAGDLALLGAGEQAASHLEALRLVRPIRRVRVWSRTPGHAHAFAEIHGVEAVDSVASAVVGADIICTLTGAREPILLGDQVAAGVHINAVGACVPTAAEVDTALVVKSRYIVDLRASAEAEAGEYLTAMEAGAIAPDHIAAELGEIVAGLKPARQDNGEITLFKSLGLAAEDLAAAQFILDRARALGVGQSVRL